MGGWLESTAKERETFTTHLIGFNPAASLGLASWMYLLKTFLIGQRV